MYVVKMKSRSPSGAGVRAERVSDEGVSRRGRRMSVKRGWLPSYVDWLAKQSSTTDGANQGLEQKKKGQDLSYVTSSLLGYL